MKEKLYKKKVKKTIQLEATIINNMKKKKKKKKAKE